MSDLGRDIRVKVMEGGPMTEVALAEELNVSKAEIRQAAEAEETVVVVPNRAERTYDYQLHTGPFEKQIREAGNG